MLLFTHIHAALQLEEQLGVDDSADYYLGAAFPDIRWLVGIPREHTHIPREELFDRFGGSSSDSFIKGYDVHLALDEITVDEGIIESFPGVYPRPVRRFLSRPVVENIFGYYSLRDIKDRGPIVVSNSYFEDFRNVGISSEVVDKFTALANTVLERRKNSAFGEIVLTESLLRDNSRQQQLYRFSKRIEENPIIRGFLMHVANPHVENFLENFVDGYRFIG